MATQSQTLDIWTRLSPLPGGKWLFSRLLCLKAPYFGSISPRFEVLRPGQCVVAVRKRRKVLNHIGTVHAIAMCNAAELAGGTMTEVTVPATHRWIPRGMDVQYLKKATTAVVAEARPLDPSPTFDVAREYPVEVLIKDTAGDTVFRAVIAMWVSPKKA
ncbi:hotdog fold domain-containing protein [Xanthomonas campestris pv. campestris]|nr:hotdog fold domain-containing protein [Xanthomonas campestris pv. campestris]